MFVNSLFKDFLMDNGLKTWHEESTRDIICLEFNYGSRSYKQELKHLSSIARKAHDEYNRAKMRRDNYLIQKAIDKRKKITELLCEARKNRKKYTQLSKEDLRTKIYKEGIDVEYITRKRDGEIIKCETIHYKMLYRSTGKAKKGTCMFICDRLYKKAIDYLYMGIKLPKTNAPIVEMSAYAPLISSGIVGKVKINPKNILILEDVDRFFKTNVVSIEIDDNKHCIANHIDNYELKNTLFDGQALIDSSLFPDWGNGYILLRQHFCKMAAFCTNIQDFMRDYYGEQYETITVTDMFGNEHYVKDIELITTDNAMKWLKMGISYDYWCEKVSENDNDFGIVKTAHPSKLGNVQKMSYQMVNSLDEDIMDNVTKESVDYINSLKSDDDFFMDYLKKNQNFANDFEVLVALCEHNKDFIYSSYFRERKKAIIKTCALSFKSGEILNSADNLTIVGSPYAMLLYGATGNPDIVDEDNTFYYEEGTIQCYTERFDNDEHLAGFRSPFNSKNNLTYMHNIYSEEMKKYFILGKQCIAVNMNGTDFQDRNNGSDQDSDFQYVTNQRDIVEHARKCYLSYPTIVNNVPKEKNTYNNTLDDFARMDNNLAKSQTDIGESSNLAQIAQSYACNFDDEKYNDYVCILATLAQIAIDNSKRKFDVDIVAEIKRIKKDMDISENKYPTFWRNIKRDFKKKNINNSLKCPMNKLDNLDVYKYRNSIKTIPMSEFFIKHPLEKDKKQCKKVEKLIAQYSLDLLDLYKSENSDYIDTLVMRSDFDVLIKDIQKTYISSNYKGLMSWLIDRAFIITPKVKVKSKNMNTNLNKNKSILLKVLYTINSKSFLECFSTPTNQNKD